MNAYISSVSNDRFIRLEIVDFEHQRRMSFIIIGLLQINELLRVVNKSAKTLLLLVVVVELPLLLLLVFCTPQNSISSLLCLLSAFVVQTILSPQIYVGFDLYRRTDQEDGRRT